MKTLKFKFALVCVSMFGWVGCAYNNYSVDKVGTQSLKQWVFLQKANVEGLKVSPKTGFSIKAGDTETQTEVIAAMTEAAVKGAVKGVKL